MHQPEDACVRVACFTEGILEPAYDVMLKHLQHGMQILAPHQETSILTQLANLPDDSQIEGAVGMHWVCIVSRLLSYFPAVCCVACYICNTLAADAIPVPSPVPLST